MPRFESFCSPELTLSPPTEVKSDWRLRILPESYELPHADCHIAVRIPMLDHCPAAVLDAVKDAVTEHVRHNATVHVAMCQHGLSVCLALAIAYYTSDAEGYKRLGGERRHSLYIVLNGLLRANTVADHNQWHAYVFMLLAALQRLPDFAGTLHRGLAFDYVQNSSGEMIVSTSFMSTTRCVHVADRFAPPSTAACRQMIHVSTGKCVEQFSMFPDEQEVVITPSTCLRVTAVRAERFTPNPIHTHVGLVQVETPYEYIMPTLTSSFIMPSQLSFRWSYERREDGSYLPFQETDSTLVQTHFSDTRKSKALIQIDGKWYWLDFENFTQTRYIFASMFASVRQPRRIRQSITGVV